MNANSIVKGSTFVETVNTIDDELRIGVDVLYALALATGISGSVSPDGYGYGPWWIPLDSIQLSALGPIKPYDPSLNTWAWTVNGIDYALRLIRKETRAEFSKPESLVSIALGLYGTAWTDNNEARLLHLLDSAQTRSGIFEQSVQSSALGPATVSSAAPINAAQQNNADKAASAWKVFAHVFSRRGPTFAYNTDQYGLQMKKAVGYK